MMASENAKSTAWLGERDEPSHCDVVSANERLDSAVLSQFKDDLMASDDAVGSQTLLKTSISVRMTALTSSSIRYTYPLSILSQFPDLPSSERLEALCQLFPVSCMSHLFFDHYPLSMPTKETMAPLRYGFACLASLCDINASPDESRALFLAGSSLWCVMIEIDNSLSRSVEMILAAVLLIPYGVLSRLLTSRAQATLLISGVLTIARRMRLHHPEQLNPSICEQMVSYSPMLWTLWLWDILHAISFGHPLDFMAGEMLSMLPSTNTPFQAVYRDMLQETHDHEPLIFTCANSNSRDQAALLLMAILSDLITVRRSLSGSANTASESQIQAYKHNPFVTFSAQTELQRMEGQLSMALDRWHTKFGKTICSDIDALYLYCRLTLASPDLPTLIYIAQTEPEHSQALETLRISTAGDIGNAAVDFAWAILDTAVAGGRPKQSLCPPWMALVTFHAALVAWAKISLAGSGPRSGYGSARAILAFRVEIAEMQWPCCSWMVETLDRLMSP